MIPFLPTPSALAPATGASGGAPASLPSRSFQETGTAPAGQFAEVFASMLPPAKSQGDRGAAAGTNAEIAQAGPGLPEAGQPVSGSPEASSVGSEPAASDAGLVMNQRAQHPSLSTAAVLPAGLRAAAVLPAGLPAASGSGAPAPLATGSAAVRETGNEVAAGSTVQSKSTEPAGAEHTAEAASVVHVPGPGPQEPFPVAVAPWLEVPLPGAVAASEDAPLPVAEAPSLVARLPEGSAALPVAPTPGTTAVDADLPATPSSKTLAEHTGVGPTGSTEPLAAGTNATTIVTGPTVLAMPATGAQAPEPAPGTAGAQNESAAGGEAPSNDSATVLVATEAVPTVANAVAQSIPPAVGQAGARIAPADMVAPDLVSGNGGISSVDPLEAAATESPLVRNQVPAPLHRQLLGPIATLAAGPNGERTLSVNIAPEALGPITVKALLGGDGIRMELSAPTDAGRDALRAMLPELRRELAATGSGAITLATGSDSSATQGGFTGNQNAGGSDARPFAGAASPGLRTRDEPAPETPGQETSLAQHATSHLDVMA